ncbi:hypothetical protein COHA_007318 [Chlorella ohadii]|uniref:Uncharacterized protein n=1 Tax=Chlorella ohadii TaxID=2649997 RepID=A0AAD5H4D2_9CHLO|nr:hypothetical protein COHA_007318 [Chlorella ohadii]
MLFPAAVLGALLAGCMAYYASGVAMLRLRHGRRRRRAAAAWQEQAPAAADGWCIGSVAGTADAPKQADAKQAVIPIQAVALASVPPAIPAPAVPSTQLPAAAAHPLPQPAIRIFSSLELTLADVSRLEAQLVASRNRFVCLQLATMAREQLAAVQKARAAGDSRQLVAAARMHFATLEVDGLLVAGALFYPRDGSQKDRCDGRSCGSAAPAEAAACTACASPHSSERSNGECSSSGSGCPAHDPHVYVELLVTNQPGRGWGSLLLGAIERHAAAHAATALAAASGCPPRSLKLLSVGSAQQFYRRCGYGEPDERKEMAKPLAAVALPAGVPAA